ncbi:MAG TPA: radical SAM protein [Gemmatimonadaceae bacterium]|nr:radical SAM protein [Gemmatimonadaceae bacterium]
MLLLQPPQGTDFGLTNILTGEPLGLECVGAAVMERGHEAELIDLRLDKWEVLDRALAERPSLVGISCAFTTDVYSSLEVASFVKERWPDLPIVVGGHHASLMPQDFFFPDSPVDMVGVGEGEEIGVAIMEAIRDRTPFEAVPGVLTARNLNGGLIPREFTRNLDALPSPARQLTSRYRRWYHFGLTPHSASLETSRGCPFDCNFCSVWVFYKRRAGRRSPGNIVYELKRMKEDHVFFTDDIAFLNYEAYNELANRIDAEGIKKSYSCETRADLVVKYRDIFPRWNKLGLYSVFLGVEKITDEGLEAVRKRTKGGVNTNVEAIKILRDAGITPMTTFITDPSWDDADFDRLTEFIDRLDLPNASFTILTPLPGTELYTQHKHELTTHDYGYFDVVHAVLPTKMPLEKFYERFAGMYAYTLQSTRPSWAMARRAVELLAGGNLWTLKRVIGAVKEMRDPASYMRTPNRIRAPLRNRTRTQRESWPVRLGHLVETV